MRGTLSDACIGVPKARRERPVLDSGSGAGVGPDGGTVGSGRSSSSDTVGRCYRLERSTGTVDRPHDSDMLRLGYKASAEQFGPRQLLDFAISADRLGFDSVWTSDHYQPWRHTDGHAPNALAWLGAAAASTERVTLGTSVLTPTLRYNPAVVAQAFATLGCLAPGRVVLGVGTGESLNEVVVGAEWPEQKERFHRLKESVMLMQQLFREDFVSFEGEYYRTHNATIYDKPDEPVPVYVAGSGPAASRLAGRIAEGYISTSGKATELYTEKLLPAVAEGLAKAGRADDAISRMIEMKVSFDTDRARAMEDTKIWAALALSGEQKMGVEDPREMERLAQTVEDVAHRRWLVSDDVDEHIEQIRPYVEWGFDHLVFHFPGDDQERSMALYAERVLPELRARFG
jgi:coenzyme F420-dependent glucose-6-phosphate dehydrogenase